MTDDSHLTPESEATESTAHEMTKKEKVRRWLIIIATVILTVFLVYLLLIVIYPSLNIGMNP